MTHAEPCVLALQAPAKMFFLCTKFWMNPEKTRTAISHQFHRYLKRRKTCVHFCSKILICMISCMVVILRVALFYANTPPYDSVGWAWKQATWKAFAAYNPRKCAGVRLKRGHMFYKVISLSTYVAVQTSFENVFSDCQVGSCKNQYSQTQPCCCSGSVFNSIVYTQSVAPFTNMV